MSAVDEIEALKQDVAARTRNTAKADGELARAEGRVAATLEALAEEFGVDSYEAGRRLAGQIEAGLDTDVTEARRLFEESGGTG